MPLRHVGRPLRPREPHAREPGRARGARPGRLPQPVGQPGARRRRRLGLALLGTERAPGTQCRLVAPPTRGGHPDGQRDARGRGHARVAGRSPPGVDHGRPPGARLRRAGDAGGGRGGPGLPRGPVVQREPRPALPGRTGGRDGDRQPVPRRQPPPARPPGVGARRGGLPGPPEPDLVAEPPRPRGPRDAPAALRRERQVAGQPGGIGPGDGAGRTLAAEHRADEPLGPRERDPYRDSRNLRQPLPFHVGRRRRPRGGGGPRDRSQRRLDGRRPPRAGLRDGASRTGQRRPAEPRGAGYARDGAHGRDRRQRRARLAGRLRCSDDRERRPRRVAERRARAYRRAQRARERGGRPPDLRQTSS